MTVQKLTSEEKIILTNALLWHQMNGPQIDRIPIDKFNELYWKVLGRKDK